MLNVDKFLKLNGMNKSQLALKAGLKQANLYAGLKNPTLSTIQRLAKALNITPGELLESQEELSPKAKTRTSKYARMKINAIVICNGEHYEASSVRELDNLCKFLKTKEKDFKCLPEA